jgi:phage-related protein
MVTVEFKGLTNRHFGLVVTHLDQRRRPEEQVEIIDIEGRSGSLVDRYGDYNSYERKIEFVHMKHDNAREIHKWLSGKGILRTSEEQHGYFYADVVAELERKLVGSRKNLLTASFLVEPHFYLESGNRSLEITEEARLINIGTVYAEPLIKIFGTGDGQMIINSQIVQLTGIQDYLTIDSKLKIVHKDNLPAGRKMSGSFPVLEEGENIVFFNGGITKLEITPRWREL